MPAGIPASEWDGFHDLIVIDEIARCGYLGVVWGLNCGNCVGLAPVVNFGTGEQKRRFIPDVLKGKKRFCLGITEPGGKFPAPCGDEAWTMDEDDVALSICSGVRCRILVYHGHATEGRLCRQRSQEMDHERHVGGLLHCCCAHRRRRPERHLRSHHPHERKGSDVPQDRELRGTRQW